jgi:hypothetical protein
MSPPTEGDMLAYPHVFCTSDIPCDPQTVNHEYSVDSIPLEEEDILFPEYHEETLDKIGNIRSVNMTVPKVTLCT